MSDPILGLRGCRVARSWFLEYITYVRFLLWLHRVVAIVILAQVRWSDCAEGLAPQRLRHISADIIADIIEHPLALILYALTLWRHNLLLITDTCRIADTHAGGCGLVINVGDILRGFILRRSLHLFFLPICFFIIRVLGLLLRLFLFLFIAVALGL